jgi:type IV secretion system protein VirD4
MASNQKSIVVLVAIGAALPALAQQYGPYGPFGPSSPSGDYSPPHGMALWWPRISALVGIAILGFIVGAFFSPMLKPFRRWVWIIGGGVVLLFVIVGPAPVADIVGWVVKAVLFFVVFFIGLRLGAQAVAAAKAARERPTSFGSAKWATFDYLTENRLFANAGFLLGEFAGKDQKSTLRYAGARHLLTVAPTRSGKGVSSIVPNLLLHEGSALVVDPKGENALITARRRGAGDPNRKIAGMGQDVVLLDPWDISASALGLKSGSFNPLDWIKLDDPDAAENAFLLADAIVVKQGGHGDNAFWDEEAKALLMGIVARRSG